MQLQWPQIINNRPTGTVFTYEIPPAIEILVDAIGIDLTAKLLLQFGGASIVSPRRWVTAKSRVAAVIGQEAALALGKAVGGACHLRLPLGNAFLIYYLRSRGHSIQDIARMVRLTDVSVRKYLQPDALSAKRRLEAVAERFDQASRRFRTSARKTAR